MMLRLAALSALVAGAYGNPFVKKVTTQGTTPRLLDENAEEAEADEDFSWMTGYTLKYEQ